jgi:hypothetical protein
MVSEKIDKNKILERKICGDDMHDLIHATEEMDKVIKVMKSILDKIMGYICQR